MRFGALCLADLPHCRQCRRAPRHGSRAPVLHRSAIRLQVNRAMKCAQLKRRRQPSQHLAQVSKLSAVGRQLSPGMLSPMRLSAPRRLKSPTSGRNLQHRLVHRPGCPSEVNHSKQPPLRQRTPLAHGSLRHPPGRSPKRRLLGRGQQLRSLRSQACAICRSSERQQTRNQRRWHRSGFAQLLARQRLAQVRMRRH
jgi:hypothetical protein